MTARLEPGRRLRRLVTINDRDYVLELTAGGVALRQPRRRIPSAVCSLASILTYGERLVLEELRAGVRNKRRRKSTKRRRLRSSSSRRAK